MWIAEFQGEKVSLEVNNWVSETTNGRIKRLLKPSDVTNANMILTNAAYFKGIWQSQFKKSNTKKNIFYSSSQDFSIIDMMVQKGSFRVGESLNYEVQPCLIWSISETCRSTHTLPPYLMGTKKIVIVRLVNSSYDWLA